MARRFIDADKIITDAIKERKFAIQAVDALKDNEIVVKTVYSDLAAFIDAQPTADVIEVKHGYWKDKYNNKYDNHCYECSVCGKKALYEADIDELGHDVIRQALTPACPYCFAKMDKEN